MTTDDAGRPVRWACWRTGGVHVLGVAAMALVVALGRNDRRAAGGLLVATYLATKAAIVGPVAVLLVRGYLADRKRTEWQR
jgi:hypothetical protein